VILEALRIGYRWASDRLHAFILQGMSDNAHYLRDQNVTYYPYVEPVHGAGGGLLESLAQRACVVVTDDFPSFFLPRMVRHAADRLDVRLEIVDTNGLLPMRAAPGVFKRAFDFRMFLKRSIEPHLASIPEPEPLARLPRNSASFEIPPEILTRWPAANLRQLTAAGALADFAIDHSVAPSEMQGGFLTAQNALDLFLDANLPVYGQERNAPSKDRTSHLSPYLHFGHISSHQIYQAVQQHVPGRPVQIGHKDDSSAFAFLDQVVTWRELGYNMCHFDPNHDQYDSLPEWARATLADHADDQRPFVYTLADFESARTHDPLWNAAQRQLVREGRIHNYLRMLWGKKILEWTKSPEEALDVMIELNNKYALDGRNPNSYTGIFWTLGRYDRPWGPERPIYGKIRYMTSQSTARKFDVAAYLDKYSPSVSGSLFS
jgi:deoxyribodipyrimidine photo-lyase